MKITGFKTQVVSVPREAGSLLAGPASFVTIRLQTDDGIEGIGYSGFVAGVMLKALKSAVDGIGELTVGEDPLNVEALTGRLFTTAGGGAPAGLATSAIAGIDVALWDLKGKAAGMPLYKLLGGYRNRIPTYASGWLWRNYDLNQLAETAPKLVQQGFTAMKFRLGAEKTASDELERVRVMREAAGPDVTLMIDINQGWNVNQAITIGRHLHNYDIFWLEDPIQHQDFAGLATIADALDTPVCAGEYHFGLAPHRLAVENRSVDIVMVDLMRAGGITGWMKAAHLAEAFNLPVVTHLATEVLAHALAAVPNGLTSEYMPWTLGMFKESTLPQLEKGELVLSDRPGLGLEFDEEALARYAA
jgi:L-alanine-DL-glutamate epimerase-like enolase superfamily enzyme